MSFSVTGGTTQPPIQGDYADEAPQQAKSVADQNNGNKAHQPVNANNNPITMPTSSAARGGGLIDGRLGAAQLGGGTAAAGGFGGACCRCQS